MIVILVPWTTVFADISLVDAGLVEQQAVEGVFDFLLLYLLHGGMGFLAEPGYHTVSNVWVPVVVVVVVVVG